MRPTIKKNHPGISVAEVAKKGGEMWKGITDKSVSILSHITTPINLCCVLLL